MDQSPPEAPIENKQVVYDFQMGRITTNRAKLVATRPHCAALFDLLYLEEDLQRANPSFILTPGRRYRLPADMGNAYKTANLLASDSLFNEAITLVTTISGKRAEKLKTKQAAWQKAGALKTIPTDSMASGKLETMDYFSSKTKYYATLLALAELKACQAVRAPGFLVDLESAEKTKNKIASQNMAVVEYLDLFLLAPIKSMEPGIAAKAEQYSPNTSGNAAADPEYLKNWYWLI